MKKKITKKEILEKLDVFRKKIKYYHDTLEISLEELSATQTSGSTPDQIKKTTAHLRQSLRKMWGTLERVYINLGIKIAFAEETNQQKIDIFYHSFSENFFHDNTILSTLKHALQLTDVAIGKCESLNDKEIARLEKKAANNRGFNKIQVVFYLGFFVAGILLAQYINVPKIWQNFKPSAAISSGAINLKT